MNWFERYGIPGLYFVLLATAFYHTIFDLSTVKSITVEVFGAAIAASLPLGYILVICSQLLYYKISPWRVHREAWEAANSDEDQEQHEDKEWWVEAEATILGRWRYFDEKHGVEEAKLLQEWFPKRFDVMAINSALILATFLGWVLVALGWWLFRIAPVIDCLRRIMVLIVISFILVVVLILSNSLLKKQARYIATEYYKDLKRSSAQTPPSRNHVS